MRDRGSDSRFLPAAVAINMNPLPISGCIGKLINAILVYQDPIRNGNFLADQFFKCRKRGNMLHSGRNGTPEDANSAASAAPGEPFR